MPQSPPPDFTRALDALTTLAQEWCTLEVIDRNTFRGLAEVWLRQAYAQGQLHAAESIDSIVQARLKH